MGSEIVQIHCISKSVWEVKLNHKMKKSELFMIKEENFQREKDLRDIQGNLKHERDANEDLEEELDVKDERVKQLEILLKNKDDTITKLDEVIKEKSNELNYHRNVKTQEEETKKKV